MKTMLIASTRVDTRDHAITQGQEQARLAGDRRFAADVYAENSYDLSLNPAFFKKYAEPQDDWDWRQYGATLLGDVKDCRVLDYGCGLGEEAIYFAKLGAHVTAIDIS